MYLCMYVCVCECMYDGNCSGRGEEGLGILFIIMLMVVVEVGWLVNLAALISK